MLKKTIELPAARAEVEAREAFLFVVESGEIRSLDELREYHRQLERIIGQTGLRRAVIDARAESGDAPVAIRDAMWNWLTDPSVGFERVAFVLVAEMAMARVNMTALARGAEVRAFDSVFEAQRWVVGRLRRNTASTTSTFPAVGHASSTPPPPEGTPRPRLDGSYKKAGGSEERVRTSPPAPRVTTPPGATTRTPTPQTTRSPTPQPMRTPLRTPTPTPAQPRTRASDMPPSRKTFTGDDGEGAGGGGGARGAA